MRSRCYQPSTARSAALRCCSKALLGVRSQPALRDFLGIGSTTLVNIAGFSSSAVSSVSQSCVLNINTSSSIFSEDRSIQANYIMDKRSISEIFREIRTNSKNIKGIEHDYEYDFRDDPLIFVMSSDSKDYIEKNNIYVSISSIPVSSPIIIQESLKADTGILCILILSSVERESVRKDFEIKLASDTDLKIEFMSLERFIQLLKQCTQKKNKVSLNKVLKILGGLFF